MKAVFNGTIVAESSDTIVIENNHYFPPASVDESYLRSSDTTTICPWKGVANYHSVAVDKELSHDAAWYYAEPKSAASEIKGYIAFWKGVEVIA